MIRYRRLVLILALVGLLLAGCGASPTETPVPTNTPEPTAPPRPTPAVPAGSLPSTLSLPERVEAALSHVQRLEGKDPPNIKLETSMIQIKEKPKRI